MDTAATARHAAARPPGPRPWLGQVGNLLAFRRDPPGFLLGLARRYGPAASFRLAGRQMVFFSDPEAVHLGVARGAVRTFSTG